MTPEQLKEALHAFSQQEHMARLDRENLAREIKHREEQICNSYNRNHYSVIYKPIYGDYNEFVKQLASELRRIQQ